MCICMYACMLGKVTEYGQYPNTDNLGFSETINPTQKIFKINI